MFRRADSLRAWEQLVIYSVLLFSSFSYNYSFILIDYVRPFLIRELGFSLTQTATLYAAQGSGVIVGSFSLPLLVSRWGSRSLVSLSSLALALASLVSLFSRDFLVWAGVRFVVGVALAGCYIASTTMLANFFPARLRGRLLSINMAMFSIALIAAGSVGAEVGESGWKVLVWLAVCASLPVAGIAAVALPDDRAFTVYGNGDQSSTSNQARGNWSEMLSEGRLRLTISCLLIAGLNFSAYQFYSGFITTYLLTVRHFSTTTTGSFVIIDGVGTLAGSFLWGFLADRKGRRVGALVFGASAGFTAAVLIAPNDRLLLSSLELGYALCLSATSCWGAYFAELFPVRLRPMGTALFHGGHLISLFAPLVVASIARSHGLLLGMALAPASFIFGAAIWWSLPETLRSSPLYRGFTAEPTGSAVGA
jgi:predicted MFS family arabinose efflux permease